MTLDKFLGLFDGVKPRGRRYMATCPAHADTNPSLQITAGDRGLLLKCWAGCSLMEICGSLGIEQADLFFDTRDVTSHLNTQQPVTPPIIRIDRRALAFRYELAALDRRLRAERIVEAGKHVTVAVLTDDELDRALAYMAQAYADVERAELFEHVADTLRIRAFHERDHEQKRRAA